MPIVPPDLFSIGFTSQMTLAMQKAFDKPLDLPSSAKGVHSLRKGSLLYIPSGWVQWEISQDEDVSALTFRVPTPVVGVKTDLLQVGLQGSYEMMLAPSVMLLAGRRSLTSRMVALKEALVQTQEARSDQPLKRKRRVLTGFVYLGTTRRRCSRSLLEESKN